MSDAKGKQTSAPDRSADEIRDDIETTREELGDTVEQLAAKTDVKGRAQAKAAELKTGANRLAKKVRRRRDGVLFPSRSLASC